ncbi:MAG: ABC transporter permease [Actinomycetota bacterium]
MTVGAEPLIRWDWLFSHGNLIGSCTVQHTLLTIVAVGVGLAISLPLGVLAQRRRRLYPPITWAAGFLYTIPSVALFVLLIPFTGLTYTTVEIGLVSYTLLILIRNVVAGIDGVSGDVKEAARGMGLTERQVLLRVEIPLALPAIMAGVRVATVSTIGLVTVGGLIGKGGCGQLIFQGLNTFFNTEIILGAVLSVALALLADGLLIGLQRVLTPWARATAGRATA